MTSAQLKEALEAAPVTIQLVSGRKINVSTTERTLVSENGAMLAVLLDSDVITTIASYNIESVTPVRRHKKPAA